MRRLGAETDEPREVSVFCHDENRSQLAAPLTEQIVTHGAILPISKVERGVGDRRLYIGTVHVSRSAPTPPRSDRAPLAGPGGAWRPDTRDAAEPGRRRLRAPDLTRT